MIQSVNNTPSFKGKAWLTNIEAKDVQRVKDALAPVDSFVRDEIHNAQNKTFIMTHSGDYQIHLRVRELIESVTKKLEGVRTDFQR